MAIGRLLPHSLSKGVLVFVLHALVNSLQTVFYNYTVRVLSKQGEQHVVNFDT